MVCDGDFRHPISTEYDVQRRLFFRLVNCSTVLVPNYTPVGWFECDLFQITKAGYWTEFEVKLSYSDFKADLKKFRKHQLLSLGDSHCPSRFFYVAPRGLAERIALEAPAYAGVLVAETGRRLRSAPFIFRRRMSQSEIHAVFRPFYYRYWDQREKIRHLGESREGGDGSSADRIGRSPDA